MSRKQVSLFSNLEPLDPDEINRAYQEWRDEDDGSDDYPSLGEVLVARFGRQPNNVRRIPRQERGQ